MPLEPVACAQIRGVGFDRAGTPWRGDGGASLPEDFEPIAGTGISADFVDGTAPVLAAEISYSRSQDAMRAWSAAARISGEDLSHFIRARDIPAMAWPKEHHRAHRVL